MNTLYLMGRTLQGAAPALELALIPAFIHMEEEEGERWRLAIAALVESIGGLMVDAKDGQIDPGEWRRRIVELADIIEEFVPFLNAISEEDSDVMFASFAKGAHKFADAVQDSEEFTMDPAEDALYGRALRVLCVAIATARKQPIAVVEDVAVAEPAPKVSIIDRYASLRMPHAIKVAARIGNAAPIQKLASAAATVNKRGRSRLKVLRRRRRQVGR